MLSCGMKCITALLFLFNFIFFISAAGIIAAGVLVQLQYQEYMSFLGSDFSSPSVMLIVVGVIAAIIAFFGCCGAVKKNYCMIMTFSALLGVILVLELAAGISAYILQEDLTNNVRTHMIDSLEHYKKNSTSSDVLSRSWDLLQDDLNCCGVTGFIDWGAEVEFANTTDLPDSCCIKHTLNCGIGAQGNLTNINQHGCLHKFVAFAEENIIVIGGVGIGIAFVQVIGIIVSCMLARAVKGEYEEVP